MRHSLLLAAVIGSLLVVLTFLAHTLFWYQTVPFFDKWMHAGAGMFVALALPWFFSKAWPRFRTLSWKELLVAVLVVGLLWEGYEYAMQALTGAQLATVPDSLWDLVSDMIGGIIGVSFVQSEKKRYNRR